MDYKDEIDSRVDENSFKKAIPSNRLLKEISLP